MGRSRLIAALLLIAAHVNSFQSPRTRNRGTNGNAWCTKSALSALHSPLSSRRDLLVEFSSASLASLLVGTPNPVHAEGEETQTILVTGANSGIGFEACKRLAKQGHRLVLACRTLEKAETAARAIEEYGGAGTFIIPAACDLASLQSIQAFANKLPSLVGDQKLDCVCYNAGLCLDQFATDVTRTADGFELTVGTNHFGHFYLNHLLLPQLDQSTGRIVVTSSSVHDPDSSGGAQGVPATLGDLQGLELQGRDCEMIDGGSFNGDKAYKDSKLCNVFFTRELQRRLQADPATRAISVNSFTPGLIVGSGLFRNQNQLFTKAFDIFATDLLKVGETVEWGGACLDYMTTVTSKGLFYGSPPGTSKYGDAAFGKQFAPQSVSKEAQNDAKGRRLWELSEKLLGIST